MHKKYSNYKPLIESFISLYLLNALNLLLPLVTLPYLFRVVGASNYGIYAFVYVIIQYVLMVSNYGFDFSATKQIAQSKESPERISTIYHAVIASRLLLTVVSVGVLFVFALIFMNDIQHRLLLLGLGIVAGEIFIPIWLFQGLEKMRFITIVNVISKSIFTVLIFVLIKDESDFQYIILLNSFGSIAAGIVSTLIAYKYIGIKPTKIGINDILFQLKDGMAVFGSTLGMNLYRNANIFILGIFVSDASVGVYAAAEKVIKAVQSVVSPIAQALFPHLGSRFKSGTIKDNIKILLNIVKKLSVILLILSILTLFFAPFIAKFIGGKELIHATPLIRTMSLVIFFGGLNYLLGIVGLINFNRQKDFFVYVMLAGLFSIMFLLLTVQQLDNLAAAIAMLLSEILLFVGCGYGIYRLYYHNKNG